MQTLRGIINGINTLLGLVIVWVLLGAVLTVFTGPGGFVMSAFFIAVFFVDFPGASSCCSCEPERVYTKQEMDEGLQLKDRHRFERREPVAFERREPVAPLPAVPALAAPHHDPFDASYRNAQAAAWAQAVRHHVPSIVPVRSTSTVARRMRTLRKSASLTRTCEQ
jgi:hypothetical protein